jgi:hypothetical protein
MQTTKPKVLQASKNAHRLTTRQIKAICTRYGWICQMERVSPDLIQVDRRIVASPHYRKTNAVMVARSAGGTIWQCIGWRWDVEDLNESQIVELLKALEKTV